MRRALFLLPLLLGGCSCHRDTEATGDSAASTATAAQAQAAADDALEPIPIHALSAVAAGADNEGTVVRHYLNAVMRGDRAAADAFWSGGRTGYADDAVLRELSGLRTLRVDTDSPIARDDEHPSRLREVPVQIRATTADGVQRYTGWYRLQPRPDGSGWELHGASLQPVLE
ncbi:hypothetical protein D3C87_388430 [compost metagenome]|nr:hypothetical protein [Stenotrophomonas sp.]